ncbi:MAG: ABC transporter substrate-binding protein [Candidatus Binatia bacterium]
MITSRFRVLALSLIIGWLCNLGNLPAVIAAEPQTIQARGSGGYTSIASHIDIVAGAKKEGQLRILSGLESRTLKAVVSSFATKYPFIEIKRVESQEGLDAALRFILELKGGSAARDWDAIYLTGNYYSDYVRFIAKYDLLAMSERGILKIPVPMIDPDNRNIIAAGSALDAAAYNPTLLRAQLVPKVWEDLLKPELKGKKFVMDVAPAAIFALTPAWGLEKVLDFARRIRDQNPVWARGHTRILASIAAGEYAMHGATNYHSAMRLKQKNPVNLEVALVEPVPTRLHECQGILGTAVNPHAALLWLEHMASPEVQKSLDELEPLKSSIYAHGSALKRAVEGKRISVAAWKWFYQREEIEKQIAKAYGFPTAEVK